MRSAGGGRGKKALRGVVTLSSFVAVWSSSVGISVDVGILVMYFLICQIVLAFALSTYSFHFAALALVISVVYSFAFALHACLSAWWPVLLYVFLSRFASRHISVSFSFHHRLLCGHGFLCGVVSCTAFVVASISCSVYVSRSLRDVIYFIWR